jgi:FlaA1/EpsC-like NDP-sugar epimerase
MIIGAGGAAHMLLRELLNSNMIYNNKICCLIDDNPAKKGRSLEGIPIVGGCEEITEAVKKYRIDIIVLSIPTLGAERRKEVLKLCQATGCRVQTVPGIYQLLNGEVGLSNLRSVEPDNLLEREPVRVDLAGIGAYVKDKTVLVTGGGGSIGSELCRQLAAFNPCRLIIVDIYENNAYDIQQELLRQFPDLDLRVLIASVRDAKRMEQIFKEYRPALVYHVAAHKHVPLMEESPNEAIKNNVLGTYHTARLAVAYGTERFVLISSDKAVNPTNIMGASKRLCEMVVQNVATAGKTLFATVRFGNVMGSNGSVIPLFEKQIEAGGPVTVTHPDVIRYFMTIPEAVTLVLQAGAYATSGGSIFVLDMGMPIKIDDLARNLIRLHGLVPEQDIQICYTGLRPGEKLYEELLLKEEGLATTANKLIFVGAPIKMDQEQFEQQLNELCLAAEDNAADIVKRVQAMVPTYRPLKNEKGF